MTLFDKLVLTGNSELTEWLYDEYNYEITRFAKIDSEANFQVSVFSYLTNINDYQLYEIENEYNKLTEDMMYEDSEVMTKYLAIKYAYKIMQE